ncbi:MAG: histidine phosphatase family protein [Paenibacillus sp.]|jgi:probable phosphoglycerate mutase|nr:histidine phosphatase family protein [Paenibacillus sp.]
MTTIGFIRHGTTDWNVSGRLQGQNDIPLNDAGRYQAKALGEWLQSEQWDAVISSDLQRAKETADIIASTARFGQVRVEQRLRERTHGRLDGTTLEERVALWGDHWKTLDHGVESDTQLFQRGSSCIDEICEQYAGQKVLVVSHGAFIGVMLNGILPKMPEGSLHNTSLSIVKRSGQGWTCTLFNSTSHIASR